MKYRFSASGKYRFTCNLTSCRHPVPTTNSVLLVPKCFGNDEESAMEAGVFNVTFRRGQKLRATEKNPHVAPGIRVTPKILSNANVAPPWVGLGRDVDRNINDLRQHEQRMAKLYAGCTKGRASNFQAEFAEACKERTQHRIDLEAHIASAQRAVTSFNVIAPGGVGRKGFIGSQLLRTFDRAWPWHDLASTTDRQ
jgi:hypothetical protein